MPYALCPMLSVLKPPTSNFFTVLCLLPAVVCLLPACPEPVEGLTTIQLA
jgi:hypothetical protein